MDGDLEELIQSIYTQVVEYYKSTITNEVLHDSASNDWSSSVVYYEGKRRSIFFVWVGQETAYLHIGFFHYTFVVFVKPTKIMNRVNKKWGHLQI